jgi:hypothetical protein
MIGNSPSPQRLRDSQQRASGITEAVQHNRAGEGMTYPTDAELYARALCQSHYWRRGAPAIQGRYCSCTTFPGLTWW